MNFKINSCDQMEWAKNSLKMYSHVIPLKNYIAANILSSLQFLPEEKHKTKPQAFCLTNDLGQNIAWLNIYFISAQVIRIRGLYVEESHRSCGHMSFLLSGALEMYKDKAKKAVSFSRKSSLKFHEKNGFEQESSFPPRTMVLYDAINKKYYYDPENEIYLLSKIL